MLWQTGRIWSYGPRRPFGYHKDRRPSIIPLQRVLLRTLRQGHGRGRLVPGRSRLSHLINNAPGSTSLELTTRVNQMASYYVLTDPTDPGSEHDTYEAARAECVKLQKTGYPQACILGDDLTWVPSWDRSNERIG